MPKVKQPLPLLKMATDRLVDFLAERCDECSINGSLDELRQVVAFIKEDIGPNIPWLMAAGFFESFLFKYSHGFKPREERLKSHKRAVLEVVMDRKIVGLGLTSSYLPESMEFADAHRIGGLSELELGDSRLYSLETFHFKDLTKFIYVDWCTDADLQIIGNNCPKLNNLWISSSKQVTDNGIAALNSCTELRYVNVFDCPEITNTSIQEFLEVHTKIQCIDFDFECFSEEGWSVYPSITEFDVYEEIITDSDLRCIAEKLPNLVTLKFYGELDESACFSTLGSLKQLSQLDFENDWDVSIWDALKPLLRIIGGNITRLFTSGSCSGTMGTSMTQADLDFLYKFCPNIEYLHFEYNAKTHGQTLIIPPFGRLRKLDCSNSSDHPDYARLQFGVMANLKTLLIANVETTTEMLESMVLDNDKFPVLNYIFIHGVSSCCDLNRIREIVKNKNIDLHLSG